HLYTLSLHDALPISYGYPSYFNKSTFEVSGLNNLASYGSRFQKWYYDGMIDTDNVIGAKWGQASGNAWNASRRPAYWFLDDEKTDRKSTRLNSSHVK